MHRQRRMDQACQEPSLVVSPLWPHAGLHACSNHQVHAGSAGENDRANNNCAARRMVVLGRCLRGKWHQGPLRAVPARPHCHARPHHDQCHQEVCHICPTHVAKRICQVCLACLAYPSDSYAGTRGLGYWLSAGEGGLLMSACRMHAGTSCRSTTPLTRACSAARASGCSSRTWSALRRSRARCGCCWGTTR